MIHCWRSRHSITRVPLLNIDTMCGYGTGDAWGCHDEMLSKLSAGIKSASTEIPPQMAQLFPTLSPLFYFAPGGYTLDFDGFYYK